MGAFGLGAGIFLVAIGTLLHVIGMTTPHWCHFKALTVDRDIGLFESCYWGKCTNDTEYRSQDRAVQAMAVLGIIAAAIGLLAALIFGARVYCRKSPMRVVRKVAGIFSLLASVFIIICIAIYAGKIFKDIKDNVRYTDQKLEYSFGLSTCAGVLLFLGGVIIMCATGFELEHYTF